MNQHRLLPSMSLLTAFEAAARHQSFTRAGEELSLTQSAVSRQVQALEALLQVELFRRAGRRITLTDVGALYARETAAAIERIRTASAQVAAFRTGVGSLHLATLPTFGSKWLLPRLHAFYNLHPGMLVHMHSRIGGLDLDKAGMDVAINVGDGHWPGMISHRIADDRRVLVASPALLQRQPLTVPADVPAHVLLQVATQPQAWRQWWTGQGLPLRQMRLGPQFEYVAHMIQAMTAGIGIGLVARTLVEEELRTGSLVVALDIPVPTERAYYLLYSPEKVTYPPLVAFRDWLLAEVGEAPQA
jgi:LysR family glycine cleavage system transcriptional activator